MPTSVSKRQYRLMMAIVHGKRRKVGKRGAPPIAIANKFTKPSGDAPESKNQDKGGDWDKYKGKKYKHLHGKKDEHKEKVKKSFEEFYKGQGTGLIVEKNGKILMGMQSDGRWSLPGGHVKPTEDFGEAAMRELKEEVSLEVVSMKEIWYGQEEGNESKLYLVEKYDGIPKVSKELTKIKWFEPKEIPWNNIRQCSANGLMHYLDFMSVSKSLKDMVICEELKKNLNREDAPNHPTKVISHGDSLSVIGNGVFRFIREAVRGMADEDFKDVHMDTYIMSIRRHASDIYSGRVLDGHKIVHQFTNKTLPELAVDIMSIFEWYLPEDSKNLELLDESKLSDDAIEGGFNHLMDEYKRHNISEIYSEMENIRQEIRNGAAVDVQQVEMKIMKLLDKMEDKLICLSDKHNELANDSGDDMDMLESKIRDLQSKVDEIADKPVKVEAVSSNPKSPDKIYNESYNYLSKPTVEISPDGKISILFKSDWNNLDRGNFLKDMRARLIKKSR